jgi:hypothetical protein
MIQYALNRSYEEMKATLANARKDLNNDNLKKEVNYRVGTFLHWLIDCYDRLPKQAVANPADKSFFSALHYANNQLKHDLNTIKIYERIGGYKFPIKFPRSIPAIEFRWCKYLVEPNPRYQQQHENYVSFVQDKEIITIADRALSIIDSMHI